MPRALKELIEGPPPEPVPPPVRGTVKDPLG
jgi:hypothetical protein